MMNRSKNNEISSMRSISPIVFSSRRQHLCVNALFQHITHHPPFPQEVRQGWPRWTTMPTGYYQQYMNGGSGGGVRPQAGGGTWPTRGQIPRTPPVPRSPEHSARRMASATPLNHPAWAGSPGGGGGGVRGTAARLSRRRGISPPRPVSPTHTAAAAATMDLRVPPAPASQRAQDTQDKLLRAKALWEEAAAASFEAAALADADAPPHPLAPPTTDFAPGGGGGGGSPGRMAQQQRVPPMLERVPVFGGVSEEREMLEMQRRRERIQKLCDEGILHLHRNDDDLIVGYTLSPTKKAQAAAAAAAAAAGPAAREPSVSPIRKREAAAAVAAASGGQRRPASPSVSSSVHTLPSVGGDSCDASSFLSNADEDPLILHMVERPAVPPSLRRRPTQQPPPSATPYSTAAEDGAVPQQQQHQQQRQQEQMMTAPPPPPPVTLFSREESIIIAAVVPSEPPSEAAAAPPAPPASAAVSMDASVSEAVTASELRFTEPSARGSVAAAAAAPEAPSFNNSVAVSPIVTRLHSGWDAGDSAAESGESPLLGLEGLDDLDGDAASFDSAMPPWVGAEQGNDAAAAAAAAAETSRLAAELTKEREALREVADRSLRLEEELERQHQARLQDKLASRRETEELQARLASEAAAREAERRRQDSLLTTLETQQRLLQQEVEAQKDSRPQHQVPPPPPPPQQQRFQYGQLQELMSQQQRQLFEVVKQLQDRQSQRRSVLDQKHEGAVSAQWAEGVQAQLTKQQGQLQAQLQMLKELQKKQVVHGSGGGGTPNELLQQQVEDQLLFLQKLQQQSLAPPQPGAHPSQQYQQERYTAASMSPPPSTVRQSPDPPSRLPPSPPPPQAARPVVSPTRRPLQHAPACRQTVCSCHVGQPHSASVGIDLSHMRHTSRVCRLSPPFFSEINGSLLETKDIAPPPPTPTQSTSVNGGTRGTRAPTDAHSAAAVVRERTERRIAAAQRRSGAAADADAVSAANSAEPLPHSPAPSAYTQATYSSLYQQRRRQTTPQAPERPGNRHPAAPAAGHGVPGSAYLMRSPLPAPAPAGGAHPRPSVSPSRPGQRAYASSLSPPQSTAALSVSPHRVSLAAADPQPS